MPKYLQREVYMQTLWFIRRYWEMREEYQDILDESPDPNGVRGTGISNPTAMKQERLERLHDDIKVIEDAIDVVPGEYQYGILANIIDREPYPPTANVRTFNRWKRRFVFNVAVRKKFI